MNYGAKVKGLCLALYGVAVFAVLAYGTSSLLAQPLTCPDDDYQYLGACASEQECDDACVFVHGIGAIGKCLNGCCHCLI